MSAISEKIAVNHANLGILYLCITRSTRKAEPKIFIVREDLRKKLVSELPGHIFVTGPSIKGSEID